MASQFTEEQLRLTVGKLILGDATLTVESLIEELFGRDKSNVPSVIISFLNKEFLRQNKNYCRFATKHWIGTSLKNGSSDFIRQFVTAQESDRLLNIFPAYLQSRLVILKKADALGSLLIECIRLFNELREKFAPAQSEDRFRNFLAQWLQSGFMPLSIWKSLHEWKSNRPNLKKLKNLKWPTDLEKDQKARELQRRLKEIKTDDFVEMAKLQTILNILLTTPKDHVEGDAIKIIGRAVYLSEWKNTIQDSIAKHNAKQIAIFAEDYLGIDCDLADDVWQGKNLIIVAKVVYVWKDSKIQLSGKGFSPGKTKAASATSTAYRGVDGKDGGAGESSGNIVILATKMFNSSRLTVELNGGRGEDGQDGGDGCDGRNGVGVTQSDLDELVVRYYSLYRDSWSNFDNYSPPSNWTRKINEGSSGDYIYRTYQDEHGRVMTYSFAADKGWTYSTYELYLSILGSNGTNGTSGGSNGVGGQGGYNGTCTVQNPETGEEFQINLIRHGKSSGPSGANGAVGISGKNGINGNDMTLIDRSASESSKHYEGNSDQKLTSSYVYKAEYKSRLNGYRRYKEKENACFIKFGQGPTIDTSERRANIPQERTVRTAASEAVAKQSIVISNVLAETETIFGKQNAFLADACEATAETAVNGDEIDEEETAAENITEEVVVLRQKDTVVNLVKYTPESEKRQRTVHTPETYVNYIKLKGRHSTINNCAQILFDLFTIEFPPELLDSVALHTLFQQIEYRQKMRSSLSLVLVAALQAKIVNGKNYDEIKQFTAELLHRRKRKFHLTRLRQRLQNIISVMNSVEVNPSNHVKPGVDKQFGIKKDRLSPKLAPYTTAKESRAVVKAFFSHYTTNEVNREMLVAFNHFRKHMKPMYRSLLEAFSLDANFRWTDKDAVTRHLNTLKSWFVEQAALKKMKKKEKSKDKKNTHVQLSNDDYEEEEEETIEDQPPMRQKTKLESDFENFVKAVVADLEYWKQTIKPIHELIGQNSEYAARFGPTPSFDKGGLIDAAKAKASIGASTEEKSIEQAQHLIKIYFLAKEILTYNHHLYICNALMLKEQGNFREVINHEDDTDFDRFLSQYEKKPISLEGDACEVYMSKHGLACEPFRYLISLVLNIKLCSYREVSFQTLYKIETHSSTAAQCEILWLDDSATPVGIAPDMDFRTLIAAQDAIVNKYTNELIAENKAYINRNYEQNDDVMSFASFFAEPLRNAVVEWVENYIAITQDQSLIHFLHDRFWVDGCHLSVFELQFILACCASLRTLYHCDLNYILLLANSAAQSQLVDVFLYARIEYHFGRRLNSSSKIYTGIQLIPNSRYKALFAVKLSKYDLPIDEDDVHKLLLMLQHASNGSEQLVNMGLDEWISIARKQKWSEMGYILKKYGSIGYYLGVLDVQKFSEEEKQMRSIIEEANIIAEKLVALYTQWIVTREIEMNDEFYQRIKKYFIQANGYPELTNKEKKYQLITKEIEQARLINWISTGKISENHVNYELFASQAERTVDVLSEKITGLHDTSEEAVKRRENIRKIAQLLKSNDQKCESIKWLNKFDDELFKIEKKRLRDTQKMAVLCAVESEKHVLEQVNTGEGKSFVIAAIATIRRKTGKRYVDIITSSPVLAQRDAAAMAKLYGALDLTVADNCSEDLEIRKKAYTADIVYGDMARFQRDYLLHTFYKKPLKGDRTQVAVIVDEVDNMLLDNGNNMLYLSHSVPGMDLLDSLLIFIQKEIYAPIYTGDKSNIEQMQKSFDNTAIKKKVLADLSGQFSIDDLKIIARYNYTEVEIVGIYEKLIQGDIIDADGYLKVHRHDQLKLIEDILQKKNGVLVPQIQACFSVILSRDRSIELPTYLRSFAKLHLDELIENCKHAMFLEANTGYVVDVDRTGKLTSALEPVITIIDSNTGADLATSQWCGGLHQFLQLKHGCRLSPISLKAVFVSNVAYLKGYEIINGLSGTLGSIEESKTLIELYKADLIKIPTNKRKIFYEHVPIIATVQEEWIQNIYDEICDQVTGTRSVLVICEDIKQLEYVLNGLTTCFDKHTNASEKIKECFETCTIYKREHDEFNFEDARKLEPHRLIIATNLAGRGTDIKLNQSLIDAGGLHVITAFMPKNCRIEEQAFGRAARCGQPGSAQIIAYDEPADNAAQPSIFQLKMFRDNKEVERLQSLKTFYDYHTEIEESCLEKFRNYCDQALSAMYSNTTAPTDDTLPTPSQVVYFALLDQWALWLDAKAPLIKQCANERSQQLKETLINSVDEFLQKHPFGDKYNCFETAKSWIDAPQSLLTIGIIQMHHKNGYQGAEDTFNKILADGYEFSAEAHYYKACMRMRNFGGTRQELKSLSFAKPMNFQENIAEAIEHFYKARTLFLNRLQRKQKEASIVAQLVEKAPAHHPKTSGFALQHKSVSTYIQLIMMNIDYLLGAPCQPNMFVQDGIDEAYSRDIYDALYRQGLISPTVLTGRPVEHWQAEPFRRKYKLHKKQIEALIERMSTDVSSLYFDDYNVLERSLILKHCSLAVKSDFWAELEQQKALYNPETYLIIHDKSSMSAEIRQIFDQLTPCQKPNPTETRTLLQYSNETNMTMMYKLTAVENLMGNNQKLKDEINSLIDKGSLKLDKTAKILIVPGDLSYFSDFDGVTTDDFKEFFHLNEHGAGWIVNLLRNSGILELQTVQMTRLTSNEERWKKLVRIHLQEPVKEPKKEDPIEFKLLFNNAGILQKIKNDRKLLNVTEEVIAFYMELPSNVNKSEISKKFYTYLIEQQILEPYVYNIWRLNSKLDCSVLPRSIADHVDEFLSDRFAYSFALEKLCLSLEAATKDPEPIPHQIFLAENPFAELADDFVNNGLAIPSRLCTSTDALDDFDYEDFKHVETIKSIIQSNRLKLYDQTDYHMEVTPFSTYILDQGFIIDSDLRAIMNNGLKVVMTRKKEKGGWWLLNKIVAAVAWCWDKIKRAASAVASFCYSVVQFVVHLPGKIFSAISNFVSPYVKKAAQLIQRIVQPLLNTRLGKMAVATMQFAKEIIVEAGYQALGAAEWVISKGTQAVNYVGKKATQAVNWIGDTRVVKGTIGVVKDMGAWIASTDVWKAAANMAVYVYTAMSNFCTAVSESYQYYNQCRTAARRLTIEKQGLVDEHAILVAFHGVSHEENKKANEENAMDEAIRSNIEAWRVPLLKSLASTLDKLIQRLSKDKYTIDFVKSALKNSFAWKNFESEVNSLLNYYAWSAQIWYFKTIQTAFENNTSFTNINFDCSQEISSEHQFFVEDGINQIFEEFEKQTNDDGYESDAANDFTGTINDIFKENIQYADWIDVLTVTCTNLMKKSIDSNFVEPTISIVLSYITSLRDANMPPSEAQLSFIQEDKNLKQALVEYKLSNQSKSKTQFLMMELYSIIHQVIKIDDFDQTRIVLKTAVKYGYPIPLSVVRIMLAAMHRFITKTDIYKAGILLTISDDQKRTVVQLKTADGKAKMEMRHIDGVVFLCRNDYCAYKGILNQTNEEIDNAFFYEAFIGYMKNLHSKFPKQAETLREGILNEL